jgi:hypothetical protein
VKLRPEFYRLRPYFHSRLAKKQNLPYSIGLTNIHECIVLRALLDRIFFDHDRMNDGLVAATAHSVRAFFVRITIEFPSEIFEKFYADVAQLVRAPDCGSGGQGFNSLRLYNVTERNRTASRMSWQFLYGELS